MSHFCLLVITDTDTDDELEKALQPFHEFECTGANDQYVQDVDDTEKYRAKYETDTESMMRTPDGQLVSAFDERFYRDPTEEEMKRIGPIAGGSGVGNGLSWTSRDWSDGKGYQAKIHFTPEGCTEVDVPVKELKSFRDYAADYTGRPVFTSGEPIDLDAGKYGYIFVDGDGNVLSTMDRTNPEAKWDWWQIGGRFTGLLTPGYDPKEDPQNQETCFLCQGTGKRADMQLKNGCNGCQGKGIATKWPTQWAKNHGDRIQIRDIPWKALEEQSIKDATDEWDKAAVLTKDMELPPEWEQLHKEFGVEKAREIYNASPAVSALNHWFDTPRIIERLKKPRDEIIAKARKEPIGCFAILHEGKWHERGQMGWFACVSDEMHEDIWAEKVAELIASLPPEKFITVVDCHI